MNTINQFIKFEPILKEKIWGGQKLVNLFGKKSNKHNIGESWEVSGVEENESIVSNGALQGKTIREVIQYYTSDFLGGKVYHVFGEKFPLLIKFIDAREALSIQVHPNDDQAKLKHNSFGKTEMWYIMQADDEGNLIVGFKNDSSKEAYKKHLNENSLLEILNVDAVAKDDVYFIPAGRVHAIGAGVLLAEVQQTSDITYRIYDWQRKDSQGNERELHIEDALEVIDFSSKDSYKTNFNKLINKANPIVSCNYFSSNFLSLDNVLKINHDDKDSFVIYMCVAGNAKFNTSFTSESLSAGETLLVPAAMKEITIKPADDTCELLEIYIP